MIFLQSLLIGFDECGPGQGNFPRQTVTVLGDAGRASHGADDPLSAVRADGGGNRPVRSILGDAEFFVCDQHGVDPVRDQAGGVLVEARRIAVVMAQGRSCSQINNIGKLWRDIWYATSDFAQALEYLIYLLPCSDPRTGRSRKAKKTSDMGME